MDRSWRQGALEIAIMLAGTLSGLLLLPAIPCVLGLGFALLCVSDRGQHRALAEKFEDQGRARVLVMSIGAHYGLGVVALSACYVLGVVVGHVFAV